MASSGPASLFTRARRPCHLLAMTEVFSWREAPPGDYAVIGDPIAHSKSPAMHMAAYRALGLDLTYRAIHVPVGEVPQALEHLRELGYRGVNVTVPHKGAALSWASRSDTIARESGGANTLTLRPRLATNTDAVGFRISLRVLPVKPRNVMILGAGGTASTILLETIERGGARLAIWNRNPERAYQLLDQVGTRLEPRDQVLVTLRRENFGDDRPATSDEEFARRSAALASVEVLASPDPAGFDLVVNATPASLRGEDLGIDWSLAKDGATAYDLAYNVDDAPFLRKAREAGIRTMDGRPMLAAQGASAFCDWGIDRLDPASVALGRTQRLPRSSDSLVDIATLRRIMLGALY